MLVPQMLQYWDLNAGCWILTASRQLQTISVNDNDSGMKASYNNYCLNEI